MSTLSVPVVQVTKISPHPNADRLEIVEVLGWQVVVQKNVWKPGDLGVYFPPDTLLPTKWTDEFGVTQYCQPQPGGMQRIRCAKLRGEPSFGLLVPHFSTPVWVGVPEETNVADLFGAQKYYPPVRTTAGDAETDHPLFPQYTDIENLRSHPDIFTKGEQVIVTSKVDGTNCRIGIVDGQLMAGSHRLRRKHPGTTEAMNSNTYWFPYTLEPVRALLHSLSVDHNQVVLYGEVHGPGIQKNPCQVVKLSFLVFDLMIDGKYLDHDRFSFLCDHYGIDRVPYHQATYSLPEIRQLAKGTTYTGKGVQEGVVVRPLEERRHPEYGRVIGKYINDEVLLDLKREDATDQ